MAAIIHQPHDKFLKLSLGEPQVAQEFFSGHLPANVLEKINLSTLKLESHSFIDETYKSSEADVVYSVTINNTKSYLYLLCEHQSSVDRLIAFRLLVYMIRLMETHLKQYPGQSLPLVYPLVQRQWCGLVEFALKYKQVRDFKKFLKILLPWVHRIEQSSTSGFAFSKIVLKYILDGAQNTDIDMFLKTIPEYISTELGDEMTTMAQQLIQRGQQQGLHQGIHQGEVAFMTRLLMHRFKRIPETYLSRIEQADTKTLALWGERILDAKTLEEVFEEA